MQKNGPFVKAFAITAHASQLPIRTAMAKYFLPPKFE